MQIREQSQYLKEQNNSSFLPRYLILVCLVPYTVCMTIQAFDLKILYICRKVSIPFARVGLFVIFFWFGILKVFGLSPANPLVESLLSNTMPFWSFQSFIVFFGIFECLIGVLFLIKGLERIVAPMLLFHMFTTLLPIILLPQIAWQSFMVPTFEGQYIIKNLVIIAAAIGIVAHLHPLRKGHYLK